MSSRLSRHQKKRLGYIVVGIVSFLLLFMSFGISLLAQSSVFLTNLFRGNQTEQVDDELLGDVEITDIPDATSSARIKIIGIAEGFSKVRFYLNSEEVDESGVDKNGEFEEEIGSLKQGDNEIYIVAVKSDSNKKKSSDKYTVVYFKDKPKLEIKEPAEGTKTLRDEIAIKGETDSGNSISINGFPAVVESNGAFNGTVRLKEGENKIIVKAFNDANVSEEKTVTVIYEK